MTSKEIAEATGKDERTVQRWAKKTGDKMTSISDKMTSLKNKGIAVDYDLEETCQIIETGMGKNAAGIFRSNAQQSKQVIPQLGSNLNQKDLDIIGAIVASVMANLDGRVRTIEQAVEKSQALLPAPQIKPKDHINMIVRDFAKKNEIDYQQAYGLLYKEYSYRTNTNPRLSAKNRNMGIIDYIETEGMIETLESVAMEVMKC